MIFLNQNELFLKLYNEFNQVLCEKYHLNDKESAVAKYEFRCTGTKRSQLKLIREMRNLLVHQDTLGNFPSFTVSNMAIDFLINQIELVKKPRTVMDCLTYIESVKKASIDSLIMPLISVMITNGYSHIPVMKNKKLIGVFSENTIFTYLPRIVDQEFVLNNQTKISDFIDILPIEKHLGKRFLFVDRYTTIESLSDLFESYLNNKNRIEMVFVTEHGNEQEDIIGIITKWDLIKEDLV